MSTSCDSFKDYSGKIAPIICLTDNDFDENGNLKEFKDINGVIFIYADWCGHCQRAKPEFAKFALMIAGTQNRAFVINGDKNKEFLQRINPKFFGWSLRGFPTIISYHKGSFFSEYSGSPIDPNFRKAKDFHDYALGIGNVQVQIQ